MNNRSHEVDSLFQRMAVATVVARDPAVEDDAARAVEDWPLLAMLTHVRTAPAKPVHHMMMPVEEPMTLSVSVAEAAPILAPEPSAGPEVGLEPETPSRALSPLEHLFRRAEQSGKPQTLQPSVFAAAPPPAAPTPTAPPLKAPAQRRLAPLPLTPEPIAAPPAAPKVAVRAVEDAVTIEPQPRQWRALDATPERLFERAGAR